MKKIWVFVTVLLLVWAVTATTLAAKYYLESQTYKKLYESLNAKVILVNICIDYGNGTVQWFNNTALPVGSTVLSALTAVAKVEYKLTNFGAYVISVNGLAEKIISKSEGYSWLWYIYDKETGKLKLGPVAADKYKLSNGDIIVWKYSHWKF